MNLLAHNHFSTGRKFFGQRFAHTAACAAVLAGCHCVSGLAAETSEKTGARIAPINHTDENHTGVEIELKDREAFIVKIENSCPSQFGLQVYGTAVKAIVEPPSEDKPKVERNWNELVLQIESPEKIIKAKIGLANSDSENLALLVKTGIRCKAKGNLTSEALEHDIKYAGYIVEVVRSHVPVPEYEKAKKDLADLPEVPAELDHLPVNEEGDLTEAGEKLLAEYDKARNALIEAIAGYEKRVSDSPLPVMIEGADGKSTELKPFSTVVLVPAPEKWQYIAAGGFLLSKLTSDKYVLGKRSKQVTNMDGTTSMVDEQFVRRNSNADDDWNTGIGAMMHLTHSSWELDRATWIGSPRFALTFGLAYSDGSKDVGYLLGPTLAWGKAFLTMGYHIGEVDILPRGLKVDDPVPTGEQLSPAEARTKGDFFIAISYSFLDAGVDSGFKKQIAGVLTPQSAPAAKPAQ